MNLSLFFTVLVTNIINILHLVEGANIVFYFGVSTYSHRTPAWPLATALAENGHNVTFVSPFPAKRPHPNVHDFVPTKLKEYVSSWGDSEYVFQQRTTGTVINTFTILPEFGRLACEEILKDTEFMEWAQGASVDLVIVDSLFNECAYGMSFLWKSKIILFETNTVFGWYTESYGLPDETSWIPDLMLTHPLPMNFFQRLKNALWPIGWDMYRRWCYLPYLESLWRDKLNLPDLPKFEEIERNTSLVFINTHYSEEFARSLPPNVVPVGGIVWTHKRNPLPNELEDFLKRGTSFIYVSFGTYAEFRRMSISTKQAIIGAIKSFPQILFVWKVENASLVHEFPDRNVFISKWMPQQDIMAHPKIKAFITHAGLLGIHEAIQNAVPLLSFPIFGDQDYNAERIHRKEYGIRLEITNVTKSEIEDGINRLLMDPKYANNMKKISNMFKERPQKPLETALWWTNFVLRHSSEELQELRPLSVGQCWWKKRQLDVWIFVFALTSIFLTIAIFVGYKILRTLFHVVFKVKHDKDVVKMKRL